MTLQDFLQQQHGLRPPWMNAMALFCLYMTVIYLPWDLFIKPLAEDQEVWFGMLFTGWAAKFGAVLHWLVYGAGSWGFWKLRRWMHPWAALYTLQIAFSMLVWSYTAAGSGGLLSGLVAAAIFSALAWALWRKKSLFTDQNGTAEEHTAPL